MAERVSPSWRRRLAWGFVDQALSSLTNLLAAVYAARFLTPIGFGAFGIGFALYLMALGVSRGFTSEVVVLHSGSEEEMPFRTAARNASGACLAIALVVTALLSLFSVIGPASLTSVTAMLSLLMPGLLLQDLWRYVLTMRGNTRSAAMNDLVWFIGMVTALAVLRPNTPSVVVLCWGGPTILCAAVGIFQAHCLPSIRNAYSWVSDNRGIGSKYTLEFLLTAANGAVLTLTSGWFLGLRDVGGLRGAMVLLGPLNFLYLGLALQAIPILIRRTKSAGSPAAFALAKVMSLALMVVHGGWVMAVFLIPARTGERLLGPSWATAHDLVLWLGLYYFATAASAGALFVLRSRGDALGSLRIRSFAALLMWTGMLFGMMMFGAAGGVAGMALASLSCVPLWWRKASPSVVTAQ